MCGVAGYIGNIDDRLSFEAIEPQSETQGPDDRGQFVRLWISWFSNDKAVYY